jgi:para-nitrobenzyl esterase
MVWFHGGSLTTGSAHEPYYTGDDLAAEGVVVVNVNYRLGPQGFLALEELADESADGAVGNYGLSDQQAGLEWVQANIAGFGGDPDAVTIFGESAGGRSVCAHLAAPGSDGLYDQAIVQSGGGCGPFPPAEDAYDGGERFMETAGCDDVACLRALPDADLIAAADALAEADGEEQGGDEDEVDFTFVADGVNLSGSGVDRAEAGDLDDVPVLIGSNADESTLFTLQLDEPSDAELTELVADVTDDPEALLALYPEADFASNLERYQALLTDVGFTCPTLSFAAAAPSAFVYHHTYVSEQNPLGLGATHGAELAPLFRHPEGLDVDIEQNDETDRMSDLIQGAWVGFATSGDPGDEFEPYADGETVTLTDVPLERVDEIRGGRCAEVTELATMTD